MAITMFRLTCAAFGAALMGCAIPFDGTMLTESLFIGLMGAMLAFLGYAVE